MTVIQPAVTLARHKFTGLELEPGILLWRHLGRKGVLLNPATAVNGGTKGSDGPMILNPTGFVAMGPMPEHMTGCTGCYD